MLWKRLGDVANSELCAFWNKEWKYDFPVTPRVFIHNSLACQHTYPSGSSVIVDPVTEDIAGFVITKMNAFGQGWISALLVATDYRGKGIGTALVAAAENNLKDAGAHCISLGGDPRHFFPGIPAQFQSAGWFTKRGYVLRDSSFDLFHDFENESITLPQRTDVSFRVATQSDRQHLLAFLRSHFPGRWADSAAEYFESGGTGEEYVLGVLGEDIIGFARINVSGSTFLSANTSWQLLFDKPLGGIGPLGIATDFRNRGYGLAVLQAAVHVLGTRGICAIVIDWTHLTSFYGRLGFQILREYVPAIKQLR